jgi:hypothetical protein
LQKPVGSNPTGAINQITVKESASSSVTLCFANCSAVDRPPGAATLSFTGRPSILWTFLAIAACSSARSQYRPSPGPPCEGRQESRSPIWRPCSCVPQGYTSSRVSLSVRSWLAIENTKARRAQSCQITAPDCPVQSPYRGIRQCQLTPDSAPIACARCFRVEVKR